MRELVLKNRSCRRFNQDIPIERKTLEDLVDLARLSASSGNLQPLKYFLSCEPKRNAEIFSCLAWAGYLPDWPGPPEGERPTAYVVVLHDSEVTKKLGCDYGIASQTITLGAAALGLAGCMLAAINRKRLREILGIPERYLIPLVLTLGRGSAGLDLDIRSQSQDASLASAALRVEVKDIHGKLAATRDILPVRAHAWQTRIEDLSPGDYLVEVKDAAGETALASGGVVVPPPSEFTRAAPDRGALTAAAHAARDSAARMDEAESPMVTRELWPLCTALGLVSFIVGDPRCHALAIPGRHAADGRLRTE